MKLKQMFAMCAAILSTQFLFSSTTLAGAGYHNNPGVSCAAYNNAQANRLTRDHVRIYLPLSSPGPLFVICPVYRVVEDMQATTLAPTGYVETFFDAGVPTNTKVDCILRFFDELTVHFPGRAGTPGPDEVKLITAMKTGSTSLPQVDDAFFTLTNTSTSAWKFYTVACKLEPGTGINSIDLEHR